VVIAIVPNTNAGSRRTRVNVLSSLGMALLRVVLLRGRHQASFISSLGSGITAVLGEIVADSNGVRGVGRSAERLTAATRSDQRNLLQGQSQSTHELRTAGGADGIVVPVGLVSDGDKELELVEVTHTSDANAEIGLEVASILGRTNKLLHLETQKFDVLECSVEGNIDLNSLMHSLATGDIFDPDVVELNVGDLNSLHGVEAVENRVQEGDLVDNHLGTSNVDAVTNIVRVLDEQEDTRTEEFLGSNREDEGQRKKGSSRSGESGDEAALEEGN
jgi:hypothetical protein